VDDYVAFSNVLNFSGNVNVTFETWVKLSSKSTSNTILGKKNSAGNSNGYALYVNSNGTSDGHIIFETKGAQIVTSSSISLSTWHHIAVSISGNHGTIYLDGVPQAKSSDSVNFASTTATFGIGTYANTTNFQAKGYIDEVRVWNTNLDSVTISNWRDTYITNSHPQYSDLLAYWKLDDGSGTTAADASISGFTGTLTNGPTWNVDVPPFGVHGAALNFDGTNDYVNIANYPLNHLNSGTIETWVKLANASSPQVIMAHQIDNANSIGVLSVGLNPSNLTPSTPGKVFFHFQNACQEMSSNQNLVSNQWYHIAISWSGDSARMYINGTLETSLHDSWSNLPYYNSTM